MLLEHLLDNNNTSATIGDTIANTGTISGSDVPSGAPAVAPLAAQVPIAVAAAQTREHSPPLVAHAGCYNETSTSVVASSIASSGRTTAMMAEVSELRPS